MNIAPNLAEIIANIIAGIHAVLIVYFLFGWLVTFTTFQRRSNANCIIAGIFLFFRFLGRCPLTESEQYFRHIAFPDQFYGDSFIARNIYLYSNISVRAEIMNIITLIVNILILIITVFFIFYSHFLKGRFNKTYKIYL